MGSGSSKGKVHKPPVAQQRQPGSVGWVAQPSTSAAQSQPQHAGYYNQSQQGYYQQASQSQQGYYPQQASQSQQTYYGQNQSVQQTAGSIEPSAPPPPYEDPGPQPLEQPPQQHQKKQGVGEVAVTQEALTDYLEQDKIIQCRSADAVLYKTRQNDVQQLEKLIQEQKKKLEQLKANTAKEYKEFEDVKSNPSVQAWIMQQGYSLDVATSKEQQEYLEALNAQEMCEQEIKNAEQKLVETQKNYAACKEAHDAIEKAYARQDEILSDIFNGAYGSEKEESLEKELDMTMDKKYRIAAADFMWRKSRKLLYHAVMQIGDGLKRWIDLPRVPYIANNMQLRCSVVQAARESFVAASQNLTEVQKTLAHIEFPYCKPSEVQTFNLALYHIFTDMMTNQRYYHAFQCYNAVHKRAIALLNWFDKVIVEVIRTDYDEIVCKAKAQTKALRLERIMLIAMKMKEVLGIDVDAKVLAASVAYFDNVLSDSTGNEQKLEDIQVFEVDKSTGTEELDQAITQAENVGGQADTELSQEVMEEGGLPVGIAAATATAALATADIEEEPPKRKPLSELAPAPSNNAIFGDIDRIQAEFSSNLDVYKKQQEGTRAQMQSDLQKKLAQRRARKERMQNLSPAQQ